MRYQINYFTNTYADFFIVEGKTLIECQQKAYAELKRRNATDPWSVKLPDSDSKGDS